ncbi:MAG: class I fructose-bisphosphate aldolase [Candidatus Brocadiia bacterium]
MPTDIEELLGDEASDLLNHTCETIPQEDLNLPGKDFVDRICKSSDRNNRVLRNLNWLFKTGRLAGTGYVSILPVDQGIEHTGGSAFGPNPDYFDPENIIQLAMEGGCNGVASTMGVLGAVARDYAHMFPFIAKLNHNELLTYPKTYDQRFFTTVERAWDLGAAGVGATVYFGSKESARQIEEVAEAFARAHDLGMFTVLWCYLRNMEFKTEEDDYHLSADMTGQANHLGSTLQADIVKQKLPETNCGFLKLDFGRTHDAMYGKICTDHPIDMVRYQVANCYMGRVGFINSGGASRDNDFQEVARTAVINKRAGGTGLITGRKAFQRPREEGIKLLNTVQDIYLDDSITLA